MNLLNVSNIRFNGADVKLAKINGVIIYRKNEEDALLIARYTANASGVLPTFNDTFEGYETEEVNNNGIYTVTIRTNKEDNLPTMISFNGKSNLLTVEYLKVTSKVTNMGYMFSGCTNLTSLDLSNFNTSEVTNMGYMFQNCTNLTSLDLSNFNTSEVDSMYGTFQNCTNLTSLDVRNFDTSKVTDMYGMFYGCTNLTSLDLSNFDVSNVTNMSNMFQSCNKLTSLDSMKNIATNLSLPASLNEESVLDVIDNLATVTTTKTLTMSATQLSWVSEDKIIEANNKGWTISA